MTIPAARINARLSRQLRARIARVQRRSGKSLTEIVHVALERYCAAEDSTLLEALDGFVGCGSASAELSTNYKSELAASLGKKGK
jgi:50S ribosomal subunit-associated GTPase HflX